MKKLLIVLSLGILVGCGEQTLTVRSTLEGDSYLRNNIESLSEDQFVSLSSKQNHIDESTYTHYKNLIDQNVNTRYLLVDERIYRYSQNDELLYVAEWVEEEGVHKLDALVFP